MPSPQNREETLFQAAVQLNGVERAALLNGACLGDDALRQRLEALLAAHDQPDNLVPTQIEAFRPTIKHDLVEAPDEAVGQTLGRYKLLERIGEGGCGVVYVAEQTEPVRRRVALKVIKLGMDTKQVVARFEAERQALAMMDHPNIAKVLDAGTTGGAGGPGSQISNLKSQIAEGRPYFVMELVRGIKITDYCDQANLTTKERLDLFIKVCQAIQHAHQKGIIHRDIKPSNILVTLHDGVPVPKVIDFGIAKATAGRLTDNTVYTQLHQFMGTPAYMSPEQAEMSPATSGDIDTRSDIYSLGVLLYELLAGCTPFDAKELMASGIDAMRKRIREREPQRPSTRLTQMLVAADVRRRTAGGAEASASSRRRLQEVALQLKGDLDWIVMKCIEKDRTHRYDTAIALGTDIQRHLNNEPVTAAAPNFSYRAAKFCRRHRRPLAVAAAFAVLLTTTTAVSVWQALRATRAEAYQTQLRTKAEADERRARETAEQNERMATVLGGMVRTFNPIYWMERGVEGWDEPLDKLTLQAREAFVTKPEAEAEWCDLMADIYHELVLRQKLEIPIHFRSGPGGRTSMPPFSPEKTNHLSRWVDMSRRSLELKRSLHPGDRPALAQSLAGLGNALWHAGQLPEAEAHLGSGVAMYRRLSAGETVAFARALSHHAIALRLVDRTNEAQSTFREAADMWARLTSAGPAASWPLGHPLSSLEFQTNEVTGLLGPRTHVSVAKVLWNRDSPLAMEYLLLRLEQQHKPESVDRSRMRQEAANGGNLAVMAVTDTWSEVYRHTGLSPDTLLHDALALERQELNPSHLFVRSLRRHVILEELRGRNRQTIYQNLGREEATNIRQRFAGDLEAMEVHLETLAQDYAASGAPAHAIALLREVRENRIARLPADDPKLARVSEALADLFAIARRYKKGLDEGLITTAGRPAEFKERYRDAFLSVSVQPKEVAALYREALPVWRRLYDGDRQKLAHLLNSAAQAVEEDGQFDEAQLLQREVSQILPRRLPPPAPTNSSTRGAGTVPSRQTRIVPQSAARPPLPPPPIQP